MFHVWKINFESPREPKPTFLSSDISKSAFFAAGVWSFRRYHIQRRKPKTMTITLGWVKRNYVHDLYVLYDSLWSHLRHTRGVQTEFRTIPNVKGTYHLNPPGLNRFICWWFILSWNLANKNYGNGVINWTKEKEPTMLLMHCFRFQQIW